MSLDYKRSSVFQPDDNFVSSMRFDDRFIMEGIQTKSRRFNLESQDYNEHRDVVDLLPSDPFGMNIGATFTAITGLIDRFEMDALNFFWNKALKFPVDENLRTGECFNEAFEFDLWLKEKDFMNQNPYGCSSATKSDGYVQINSSKRQSGGEPHEALLYVLGYLGVNDLLSVERVCKSLHSTVRNDPLLWRNIRIDQPLNEQFDDSALLQITSRAQGSLHALSLIKCTRVTDEGLKPVLKNNPRLAKLIIPECTKLTVEGILSTLKDLQSSGAPGLKLLRIGGRCDVKREHFEELKLLLGMSESVLEKPRIYHGGHSLFPYNEDDDDSRVIDIEVCPLCDNLRLVYDCPIAGCQVVQNTSHSCRACTICIWRCVQCGRCVNDGKYVETFCLDKVCLFCDQLSKDGASCKSALIGKNTKYQIACG